MMGQSTNATMAFGFDLGEELPESFAIASADDDDGFEADEFLLRHYNPEFPEWEPDGPPDWHVKQHALLEVIPVNIIKHCSGDYPMYFLAVRDTDITATRGSPSEAPQTDVSMRHIGALREFCDKYGIEWQEPRWYIFSMWD